MTLVYVLLGSNTGAMENLKRGVALLREQAEVVSVSSVYRTAAQGKTAGGADYLNMAVALHSTLEPTEFKLSVLRSIESTLGRERGTSNVTIDLDIMLWGETPLDYGNSVKMWHSPHPDLLRYAYAAVPVAEIAQGVMHPETGEPLREIAARLLDDTIVRVGELPP